MEILGKVKVVGVEQQVSPTFKKRELVVTTEEQYPQSIMIEFVQDKVDLLNSIAVGENVKVFINISGKEWINPQGEARYFNSIKGWKIEKQDTSKQSPSPNTAQTNTNPQQAGGEEIDDLPFK